MKLLLRLDPSPIEFTEELSGGAFPYLIEVAALRVQARAGYIAGLGVGESPNLLVTLDNCANRVADIVGTPLRARAAVYGDDDSLYFAGIVSGVSHGRNIGITIGA